MTMKVILTLLCVIFIVFGHPLKMFADPYLDNITQSAKTDAEGQATTDMRFRDDMKWLLGGMCFGCAVMAIGGGVSLYVADQMYPKRYIEKKIHHPGFEFLPIGPYTTTRKIPNQSEIANYNRALTIGSIVAYGTSLGWTSFMAFVEIKETLPLPERMVGKPPAYVTAYIAAYESKSKSMKRRRFIIGSVIGSSCMLPVFLSATED